MENKLNSFNEHKECLEAILTGDHQKARNAMEQHILHSMRSLLKVIDKKDH
jgi:DNA-binding GntR family transcriptional regulator